MVTGVSVTTPTNNIKKRLVTYLSLMPWVQILQLLDLGLHFLKKIKKTAGITSPDQIWSGDKTGVQNVPKEVKSN